MGRENSRMVVRKDGKMTILATSDQLCVIERVGQKEKKCRGL